MPHIGLYADHFSTLTSYGRTLDYYRIMFREGPFARDGDRWCDEPEVELLDQINYAYRLFDDPLPLGQLLDAFGLEPGYGVPDGAYELGPFVRHLELCRGERCARHLGSPKNNRYEEAIGASAVGIGHGATGALTTVIGSIIRTRSMPSTNVVMVSPNYCISEDVARLYGLQARNLRCSAEDRFLPSPQSLKDICDAGTAAICITMPTNPSHDAWTISDADAVGELIGWCQEHEIFFVLDTVFQDQSYSGRGILEPFVIAGSDYCIVKVFGPSKDRPFACGHRIGYFIGDRRLSDEACHLSHILLNSPNAYSKMWFGFELLFRAILIQGRVPTPEDCRLFCGSFLFGEHFRDLQADDIWTVICERDLYGQYSRAVTHASETVRATMVRVHECVSRHACFEARELPDFGNSLFVKVSPEFHAGTDHEFFWRALTEANVGILVGNAFGLPFPSEETWFRVVCVAEEANVLVERVDRIAGLLSKV